MIQMLSITKKELKAYFGSPMAVIFIGAFLLSALFSFFWVETFFARNTADIRPLFRWMPVLMIFLVAALTMRQWSEEQKMGTLEILLTLPVRFHHLVLGKFFAVLALVGLSLALTLGLPLTVSFMGNLDWGPVAGGYLGALLMASAYIAIGLFVSSKTDNQIVALILTVLICGFFYLVGSAGIADFMGSSVGNFFRALGTGSRFASIERGVIDLRDLVYYGSVSAIFLTLNILSLDSKRWSSGKNTLSYRRNAVFGVILVAANILALNIWLAKASSFRLDLTEDREYSISTTTRDLLSTLQEPLLMRGYFSEKTHPLLAPLVPRIKDMMAEYKVAAGDKIKVEFVDPKFDENLEAEANQQYGIKPVPFQVAGRYEASVVNSYFNILIKYGDQYVTLGFNDLIEVKPRKDGQLDVGLRNLEYDLTKSIKKVVYGFQSIATVFENIDRELKLIAVITPSSLPEGLADMPGMIAKVAGELSKESQGKLSYVTIDPDKEGISPETLEQQYDIKPLAVSFLSPDTFYMHLLLQVGNDFERVYLAGDTSEVELRQEIESMLKRNSSGFLKTIGLWTPKPTAPPQMAMYQPPQSNYQVFQQVLQENYNLEVVDLADARVPGNIDVLLVVAPQDLDEKERFAIDQYLMRGGSVVALAGNYVLDLSPYSQSLNLKQVQNGLAELLASYGIEVGDSLVMDQQNEPFPVPVERDLGGGIIIREVKQLDYPFFVDIRSDGMDEQSPVVANLPAVTMNWVSPLVAAQDKNDEKKVSVLLKSSDESWLTTKTEIQPDFDSYPATGFAAGDSFAPQNLAVTVKGQFDSFFADKPDPRLATDKDIEEETLDNQQEGTKTAGTDEKQEEEQNPPLQPVIKQSPQSSRLAVVGSSEFINDTVISISRSLGQDRFMNGLEFLQNLVDWSVEDEELLAIRSRGSHARLLMPMSRGEQTFWEWLNYGIALFALLAVSFYGNMKRRKEQPISLA